MELSKVLVPLDGSPAGEAILPFILQIAGPLDVEVVLLRVVQPIPPQVIEGSRHVVTEDIERRRLDAEEYLAPVAAELRAKGVLLECWVRRGDPLAARHRSRQSLRSPRARSRPRLGRPRPT